MYTKSSCNCCINVWDDFEENKFDLYVIFPEYMGNEPLELGVKEMLEAAYEECSHMEEPEEVQLYIQDVLNEKEIEYIAVLCRKL